MNSQRIGNSQKGGKYVRFSHMHLGHIEFAPSEKQVYLKAGKRIRDKGQLRWSNESRVRLHCGDRPKEATPWFIFKQRFHNLPEQWGGTHHLFLKTSKSNPNEPSLIHMTKKGLVEDLSWFLNKWGVGILTEAPDQYTFQTARRRGSDKVFEKEARKTLAKAAKKRKKTGTSMQCYMAAEVSKRYKQVADIVDLENDSNIQTSSTAPPASSSASGGSTNLNAYSGVVVHIHNYVSSQQHPHRSPSSNKNSSSVKGKENEEN